MSEAICGTPRDALQEVPRISRSLSSGARSRAPLAHPGYAHRCTHAAAFWGQLIFQDLLKKEQ